jgi:hypothetical protein
LAELSKITLQGVLIVINITSMKIQKTHFDPGTSIRLKISNPNNPVVIFHSLSIASLTPECIHLGNPSTGRNLLFTNMEVDAALSSIETKYSFKFKEFGF